MLLQLSGECSTDGLLLTAQPHTGDHAAPPARLDAAGGGLNATEQVRGGSPFLVFSCACACHNVVACA